MKILVLNGPNLNLLGKRDVNHYGDLSLDDIESLVKKEFPEDQIDFFQTNIEGELITHIQNAPAKYDGLIINPGGYTHTSVAIKDSLETLKIPKIEVHLSNLSNRDDFRQQLITTKSCTGYISGFKDKSYLAAIYLIKKII